MPFQVVWSAYRMLMTPSCLLETVAPAFILRQCEMASSSTEVIHAVHSTQTLSEQQALLSTTEVIDEENIPNGQIEQCK